MALERKNNNLRKRSGNGACGYWAVGTKSTSNGSLEKRHIFSSLPPYLNSRAGRSGDERFEWVVGNG
jgi:hypothetical protein